MVPSERGNQASREVRTSHPAEFSELLKKGLALLVQGICLIQFASLIERQVTHQEKRVRHAEPVAALALERQALCEEPPRDVHVLPPPRQPGRAVQNASVGLVANGWVSPIDQLHQ